MTISPLQEFDREASVPGKVLEIPLILTDKAGKTNHASVHVIIGDEVGFFLGLIAILPKLSIFLPIILPKFLQFALGLTKLRLKSPPGLSPALSFLFLSALFMGILVLNRDTFQKTGVFSSFLTKSHPLIPSCSLSAFLLLSLPFLF